MNFAKIIILIAAVLLVAVSAYFVRGRYFSSGANSPAASPETSPAPANEISPEDARDNQRIDDLLYLSGVMDTYALNRMGFPFNAPEGQKISDESSPVYLALKNGGYLDRIYADPLPDKYYYGYRSIDPAGSYELTAVLENKASGKCEIIGNLCLFKIKKTLPAENEGLFPDEVK